MEIGGIHVAVSLRNWMWLDGMDGLARSCFQATVLIILPRDYILDSNASPFLVQLYIFNSQRRRVYLVTN